MPLPPDVVVVRRSTGGGGTGSSMILTAAAAAAAVVVVVAVVVLRCEPLLAVTDADTAVDDSRVRRILRLLVLLLLLMGEIVEHWTFCSGGHATYLLMVVRTFKLHACYMRPCVFVGFRDPLE
jgi:hypothetical protein